MGSNTLGGSASAYLRSAAGQPVWWHGWGTEAFERARAEDRPVLLDIGAVWCHWCHVMDHESYEDPDLADFLNRHFVCVKVDRDEVPDVDARYQRAVQALTRQGGWPLTGFLTPDAELFFGGTYFPPAPAGGMPSFRQVLERVHEVWRSERALVARQAGALRAALAEVLDESAPGTVGRAEIAEAGHRILAVADRVHGGFGQRPKFPHPATLTLLLHRWYDDPEPTLRSVIERSLDGMANGGFRDLLGGGFHRYSVDERWIVPHFEKMASDNAELLQLYASAGSLFGRRDWLDVARDAIGWIDATLAQPGGGFGASQDADLGPDDDGSYFTWTAEEIEAALSPEEARAAIPRYGVGTLGRMPHDPARNVLFHAATPGEVASRLGLSDVRAAEVLAAARAGLRNARNRRPAPFVDAGRYANWNAMLAGALLRAGPILGAPDAVELGLSALRRLRTEQPQADRVAHRPGGDTGLLDDQVASAAAALDAWEVTADRSWLDWAVRLMEGVMASHWDADKGGCFDRNPALPGPGFLTTPAKPIQDSPNASPNGIAGVTLARLFEHTGDARWRELHAGLVGAFGGLGEHLGLFASAYLLAADWLAHPTVRLTVSGPARDETAHALHRQALASFLPRRVVLRAVEEEVRAVACVGTRCLAAVSGAEEWAVRLRSLVPTLPPH